MQKIITQWLHTALIISLGFGQLLRFEIFGLPLFVHDFLIVIIILLNCNVARCTLTKGIKLFLLGLGIGWLRAFTLYPIHTLLIPSLYTMRILGYLALYLVVKKQSYPISHYIFVLAGMISLFLGLAQYIFIPDMRIFYYLGWDDHLNRLIMPHYDPTFSAAMLSLFFFYTYPHYHLPSVLHFTGILLSYSRSVWLTFILTIFASTKKFAMFFLSALILLIAASLLPQGFGEGNNLLRTFSITSRLNSDLNYLSRYKWDLFFGRGLNTLVLENSNSFYVNHANSPNNSYLYLLLTSGVLGLIGWGTFLKELYQSSKYKPTITFLIIGSFFNNMMFYPFTLLLVLLSHSNSKVPSEV